MLSRLALLLEIMQPTFELYDYLALLTACRPRCHLSLLPQETARCTTVSCPERAKRQLLRVNTNVHGAGDSLAALG
jgi:hypothetical protein